MVRCCCQILIVDRIDTFFVFCQLWQKNCDNRADLYLKFGQKLTKSAKKREFVNIAFAKHCADTTVPERAVSSRIGVGTDIAQPDKTARRQHLPAVWIVPTQLYKAAHCCRHLLAQK